jgi:hypothetical protein
MEIVMIESIYSHDGFSVVAIYDLDINGNPILETPRYAVIGPDGFYRAIDGNLPAAIAAMDHIIATRPKPTHTPTSVSTPGGLIS